MQDTSTLYFILFPQCFQKSTFFGVVKSQDFVLKGEQGFEHDFVHLCYIFPAFHPLLKFYGKFLDWSKLKALQRTKCM